MDPLSEAFQHHTWATEKLIRHLRGLPEAALNATGAGVYGEVLATLSHLLAADGRYLGTWKERRLRRDRAPTRRAASTSWRTSFGTRPSAGEWCCPASASWTSRCPLAATAPSCRTPRICWSCRLFTTATTIALKSAPCCRPPATRRRTSTSGRTGWTGAGSRRATPSATPNPSAPPAPERSRRASQSRGRRKPPESTAERRS
jgi:hypothetical protein